MRSSVRATPAWQRVRGGAGMWWPPAAAIGSRSIVQTLSRLPSVMCSLTRLGLIADMPELKLGPTYSNNTATVRAH